MKESIAKKQEEVEVVAKKMKEATSVVVFKYQGLTVDAFQSLRREMRANGSDVAVIKNNISNRAAKSLGYDMEDAFKGPVALAFSKDLVAPAKILFKAAKAENAKVQVVKGIVDGDVYSFEQLQTLSTLPSYETLLTQLAAGMLGTLSQLAIGLNMIASGEGQTDSAKTE